MAVQTTYPGVYIDEFAPGAPIEGVGTSTAAFIGLAPKGTFDAPTKLTSWDQFLNEFGTQPVPGGYLWYAVRGFFDNGGQVCYVVRASNGRYDEWDLQVRSGTELALQARARAQGASNIQLTVTSVNLLPAGTAAFRPGAAAIASVVTNREIVLGANQAIEFRPADFIVIGGSPNPVQVIGRTGDTLRLATDPNPAPAAGDSVELANLPAGATSLRIFVPAPPPLPQNCLVPGSILTIDTTLQGGSTESQIIESVQTEFLAGGNVSYRVNLQDGLRNPIALGIADPAVAVTHEGFSLTITVGVTPNVLDNVSLEKVHPRYLLSLVNDNPDSPITLTRPQPPPTVPLPGSLPVAGTFGPTRAGVAENLTTIGTNEFQNALDALRQIDDVNIVAVPDAMINLPAVDPPAIHQATIAHCEQLADRFAVLDAKRPISTPAPLLEPLFGAGSVDEQRNGVDSTRGYAALYYPWLQVRPARGGDPILVPPSGHVCGIFARSDIQRGVHKAPANELVNGVLGVQRTMSDIEQGQLNIRGVNVLRVFAAGGRVTLWGARTTATDRNWQYVNVRRLFLYLEESIQDGIRWAVFEPNNPSLWKKLKRSIVDFLMRAYRDGAFGGATPEDSFYVRIDEALNPESERRLGRLYIEIGVRPAYPAEFIIVRIGIWLGGGDVKES